MANNKLELICRLASAFAGSGESGVVIITRMFYLVWKKPASAVMEALISQGAIQGSPSAVILIPDRSG